MTGMHHRAVIVLAMLCCAVFADVDTRVVQAEFDRCVAQMERVERSLKRLDDALNGIKRAPSGRGEDIAREVAGLENRLEYFRNRFERAQAQAEKNREDLKASGATCQSCVESSVKLYCRSGEALQADIDDCLGKAAEIRTRMGLADEKPAAQSANSFERRSAAADSLYRALSRTRDECADTTAAVLMEQARINFHKADSLHQTGNAAAALQAIDIAHVLLEKAAKRCESAH